MEAVVVQVEEAAERLVRNKVEEDQDLRVPVKVLRVYQAIHLHAKHVRVQAKAALKKWMVREEA